ncbi:hypothetical protein [Azotobacter salinestris]|uniref:hypothetical protein n=1 Tax=Azotobacter salinestris TaxID=69964 RepID=UPI0032E00A39
MSSSPADTPNKHTSEKSRFSGQDRTLTRLADAVIDALDQNQVNMGHLAIGITDALERSKASTDRLAEAMNEQRSYTAHMSDQVTLPLLDAKLETFESKIDGRIEKIESAIGGFKDEAEKLRAELSHAKWWAIGTAIAVVAIFISFLQWGLQAQKDENARFSSYLREDMNKASDQNRKLLDDATNLLQQIKAQQAAPASPPPAQ